MSIPYAPISHFDQYISYAAQLYLRCLRASDHGVPTCLRNLIRREKKQQHHTQ